jgi:hypothetical protein
VASTKRSGRQARAKKYVPSEKQRAEDERLREQLRHFYLEKFDKALKRALRLPKSE